MDSDGTYTQLPLDGQGPEIAAVGTHQALMELTRRRAVEV